MDEKSKLQCPEHDIKLRPQKTKWGVRYCCPAVGCSVVCWDNTTSTPADYETRQARHRAHAALDLLWKIGGISKGKLYKRISEFMGLSRKNTHIGYFDIRQCERVIAFCEKIEDKDNG